MERIDVIIASVGAAAIVATVLGVVFYEELASVQDVTFDEFDRQVAALTGEDVTGGANYQFMVGENATSASVTVVVRHTGAAYNPDGGSVRVEFLGPNGTSLSDTQQLTCSGCPSPTGAQLAPLTFTFDARFFDAPTDTTTEDPVSFDQNKTWMDNYQVRITITNPTDTVPSQVGASYTFEADITVAETYFQHRFVSESPENI